MEYTFGNMDEGQIIFHPHIPQDHSDMDLSNIDISNLPDDSSVIERHQQKNLERVANEVEKELDIHHIDNEHFSDYVKGKITTIDGDEEAGESMDYDIGQNQDKEV